MPAEIATICFHTRDAVQREGSSFTFDMPSDRLRNPAAKVALASCEFPMVQWTVEEGWNRFYMNEGVPIDVERSVLRVALQSPSSGDGVVREIHLPCRINRVKSESSGTFRFEHPHGLFSSDGVPLRPAFQHGVTLIGGRHGDRRLLHPSEVLPGKDANTLRISRGAGEGCTALLVSTIPSPRHLCEWMTAASAATLSPIHDDPKLSFAYDPKEDRVRLTVVGKEGRMVRILHTPLATMCGLSTVTQRLPSSAPYEWPSQPTVGLWDYVEMPSGFYAPCHRPMCTGQPLRFSSELEAAVNRLYFPLVAPTSPHRIVFADPEGRLLTSSIPSGRYTPRQLCLYLEHEMTKAATPLNPGIAFAVDHEEDRFIFSCERKGDDGIVRPATFELLFHHPMSIEASRLGFASQPYAGSHTYVAGDSTRVATVGPDGRTVSNIVRVNDVGSQKRFQFHCTHPPPMIGVVSEGGGGGTLRLRTHVNKLPFAHGFQTGDVVRVSVCGATKVTAVDASGTLGDVDVRGTAAVVPAECSCLVIEDVSDPCVLCVRAPALDGLRDAGTAVNIVSHVEPWNLCFCRERSIPGSLVGFPDAAVQWGVDGSVGDGSGVVLMPPFVAPHSHCLDHPDYVLMTFSESSGASLEHSYAGESKMIFCKLSLYPLFREERMLPRDTSLLGTNLSRFTIAFWNPDMRTPYEFHGAQFSFSLAFIGEAPPSVAR